MWKYQLDDHEFTEQIVALENGVTFDLGKTDKLIKEKKEFLLARKRQMQWIGEPELDDHIIEK